MAKDKYKDQFARATAEAFRRVYPDIFEKVGEKEVFAPEVVYEGLAKPKDASMGRFAFPVFRYAGLLKQKPPEIAAKVAEATQWDSGESVGLGGFLNARIDPIRQSSEVISSVITSGSHHADSDIGKAFTEAVNL